MDILNFQKHFARLNKSQQYKELLRLKFYKDEAQDQGNYDLHSRLYSLIKWAEATYNNY
jgi:hypothetical protein